MINYVILDDIEYLLLQNSDKERYKKKKLETLQLLWNNMGSSMKRNFDEKSDPKRMAKIKKIQNVVRQLGMHTLVINSMKEIYYRHNDHYAIFSAILKFFESYYCYKCPANQISLLPYINYLLSLHQLDLDSLTLISQILRPKMNDNGDGTKFFKFIVERVI